MTHHIRRLRRALTLIETLVVIGILALLLALLLPAVQKVRESASKIRCTNRAKQLVLAWHLHVDTHGYYPTKGYIYDSADRSEKSLDVHGFRFSTLGSPLPGASGTSGQTASWNYQILPYLEQGNIWSQPNAKSYDEACANIVATPVSVFFCASRGRQQAKVVSSDSTFVGATVAFGDFAANVGTCQEDDGLFVMIYDRTKNNNPVPGLRRPADITNGLSQMLFLGEAALHPTRYVYPNPNEIPTSYYAFVSQDNWRLTATPPAAMTNQVECIPMPPLPDQIFNPHQVFSFGSPHPSGLTAAFGDGSVRRIAFTVSPQTWKAIGSRNNGVIPDSDY